MRRNNINDLINKFNIIHNNKYDYSLVNYINNRVNIDIICPYHGIFSQSSHNHLKFGCSKCTNNSKLTTYEFISRSNIIHDNKYDYSLVNYINNNTKVSIICPYHNIFEQIPLKHINSKQGCPKCGGSLKSNVNNFISNSNIIHNNKYDYSLTKYTNAKTKVTIICPKHGEFKQTPNNHLSGYGCLNCRSSKGELLISKILKDNNINFISQYYINGLYLDFYLPDKYISIEYDGEQHFKPIEFFGGIDVFNKQVLNDNLKNKYCEDMNIKLIRIPFTEFNNIENIILENVK